MRKQNPKTDSLINPFYSKEFGITACQTKKKVALNGILKKTGNKIHVIDLSMEIRRYQSSRDQNLRKD